MKVKCICDYYDQKLNKAIKKLDEYEVSDERAKELSGSDNKAGFPLVEILTPTTEKVVKAPAKKAVKKTGGK